MSVPFPLNLPGPTAFYLVLYLTTLVVHVVFMNYVLAGTAYLAVCSLIPAASADQKPGEHPFSALLRDWMPFILSAAITAGIAPLLFLQILYQRSYYTANLLLFHRWMIILPVLIVGFYLLYLLKSRLTERSVVLLRTAVGIAAFVCFAFVAWSWTENHLLSLAESAWPEQYASGRLTYRSPELFPRLALWFSGAFPTMALCVSGQVWYLRSRGLPVANQAVLRCARIAMAGLVVAAICAVWYAFALPNDVRSRITAPDARGFLPLAVIGWGIQFAGWRILSKGIELSFNRLAVLAAGLAMTLVGMTVLREMRRLAAIDIDSLFSTHANAASVGGLNVFLFFFAVNAGLIGWCLATVRRGLRLPQK